MHINLQSMKQVRKGIHWSGRNGCRLLKGLHSGMDCGNGDETMESSNISLTRFKKHMWWQVRFHF